MPGVQDIAGAKRRISGIGGVVTVNFNQLNQKLLVRYEGDEDAMQKINLEIKEILNGTPKIEDTVGPPTPKES
jgi:hypothetical protein